MFPVRSSLAAFAATMLLLAVAVPSHSAVIDPNLSTAMTAAQAGDLLSAVVTYNAQPNAADIQALRNLGIKYGMTFQALPIAGIWANKAQINTIAGWANVRSIWLNSKLTYYNKEATALIGAVKQRTAAGFGFSGKGVGVAIVDSGIDGTHPDLPYPSHVKSNVKVVVGGPDLGSPFDGIVPETYVENVPDTDGTSGHGTHCAGIIGGLGTQSGGMYAGVAPGADLIGISTGETIVVLWALAGWDYVLTHRYLYNIRVCSNSWGSSGPFNPDDPINVAAKILHDNGITVCFASGNSGPGSDTLGPNSVAPWVIGVAAGDKAGKLADFSSRGIKGDTLYHPDITAPGVSIVSCRAKGSVLGAVSGDIIDDPNLDPAAIPYYAHLSGTSMACPSVAGCCALLLEANPSLTPDQIKSILQNTTTRMAGYEEFQVGAGYVNVYAALDLAKNSAKVFGTVLNQTWNAKLNGSMTTEKWDQAWDPTLAPPTHNYAVNANGLQSDVFITWDNPLNTFNLAVTDPSGTQTSTGSNLLWLIGSLSQSLGFPNPAQGNWFTTVYGLKGQSTGTTGLGVFDTVHGTIINYYGTFSGLSDISGSPYEPFIRRAVALRLIDAYNDSTFRPTEAMNRGGTAKLIASDCWTRQNLLTKNPFTDVNSSLAPYVQAVTSSAAPMRDVFWTSGPIMSGVTATSFSPSKNIIRAELAMWLVRALGREADAQANMSTATSFTDDATIPAWARGYVVVASNIGLMPGFLNGSPIPGTPPTYSWKPNNAVPRGEMAMTMLNWHDIFMQ